MTKPLIKICGITNKEDALHAVRLEVWALGFVFAESPRHVSVSEVKDIAAIVPSSIARVGVFVNERSDVIKEIVDVCKLAVVQLHGNETPDFCDAVKRFAKVMKAFRIRDEASLEDMNRYDVDYFLLDAYSEAAYGGTGTTFDWDLAGKAKAYAEPLVLSGGLNPGNVAEAIKKVRPYAVDVASGIEASPGKKDKKLLKQFVSNVRGI